MTAFDWSPYAVGGAAARPDSFTGLNPGYAAAVAALVQAADAELGPGALRITSAYRSPEVQAVLWENALAKYGSPEAARKWVAPPGKSQHNFGMAVDFADASGSLLRDPNSREARWIAENAARFGLAVPMSWEPWQVELAGARDGAMPPQGMPGAMPPQTPGAAPQNALAAPRMVDMRQDPAAFMRAPNALADVAPIEAPQMNNLRRLMG